MAYAGELGIGSERSLGHRYGDVSINDGAKAHLGDSYHVRVDDPLHHLPYAKDAPFNAYSKQYEHDCHPGTRFDLLHEIYRWADRQDERHIFWLSGLAGTGKSTVARTVARSYHDKQRLAASFFFSRGGGDAGHAARFVTSLAVQLAHSIPALRQHICDAVTERNGIVNLSLRDQWQQLVCRPLSKLSMPESYVVVIDALDECDNDNNIRIILQLLVEARSLTTQLRVLLTSRPEVPIRYQFKQMADGDHKDFVLHDISQSIVDHDIGLFLQDSLQRIAQERYLRAGWPGPDIVAQLVESASGRFIWAETACRFIQEGKGRAPKRLETILCRDTAASVAPEKHLNELYTTVLQNSIQNYTEEEKEEQSSAVRYVLGSIVALFSPLSTQSLDQLLSVAEGVRPILEDLHAILDIPNDLSLPLRLHHPSLRDFLFSKERCGDENFWVDEKSIHKTLASRCLELMSASGGLRQDICNLSDPGVLRDEIEESKIIASLSPELQYVCRYWVTHLECSGRNIEDGDTAHRFLEKHFLHWLEVMSLIRETGLCERLVVRMQSLAAVDAVVFSPNGKLIVSASHDYTVRLWEVATGQCYSVLQGHSGPIRRVAFSPDGQLVASGSDDSTVRLWETATGCCRKVLKGHSNRVSAVVFSPDGKLVASTSEDGTARLWETAKGCSHRVLNVHSDRMSAAVFSPDGKVVALATGDDTVQLWETATGYCRKILECYFILERHLRGAIALVFSSDGQLITLAFQDGTVWLWDTATGDHRRLLESHLGEVETAAFSPDGQMVAFSLEYNLIQLCNIADQDCRVLEGHSRGVVSVFFSPDSQLVASASGDSTLRLWKVADQSCRVLKGHMYHVVAAAFSPDGKLVVSASRDFTLRVWETESYCSMLEHRSSAVEMVVFAPGGQLVASLHRFGTMRLWNTTGQSYTVLSYGRSCFYNAAFSADAKLIASASDKGELRVWDTTTGQCRWVSDERLRAGDIEFLPDGQTLRTGKRDITLPLHLRAASTIPLTPESPFGIRRITSFRSEAKQKWIFHRDKRFMWLPPEYRTDVSEEYQNMVCLGYFTGRVVLLRFGQPE